MKPSTIINVYLPVEIFSKIYQECAAKKAGTWVLFDKTQDGIFFFVSPKIVARESFYIPLKDIETARKRSMDTELRMIVIPVKTTIDEEYEGYVVMLN